MSVQNADEATALLGAAAVTDGEAGAAALDAVVMVKVETRPLARHHWCNTVFLIVAAMSGTGLLAVPSAVNSTGWVGIGLLILCALLAAVTAHMLGLLMRETPFVVDYSSIGQMAFGKHGRRCAQVTIYTTLIGVTIVFLILGGLAMSNVVPYVSHGFWTLAIGVVMLPVVLFLRTLNEVRWISYIAVTATIVVLLVVIGVSVSLFVSPDYPALAAQYGFTHSIVNLPTLVVGFGAFTFAFANHSVFPSMYSKMRNPRQFHRVINTSYGIVVLITLSCGLVGYLVFGSYLGQTQTILDALTRFTGAHWAPMISEIAIVLHILTAMPVVIIPVFNSLEHRFHVEDRRGRRIAIRIVIFPLCILFALFFPYFLDFVSLISDISIANSVYILPALFYWRLKRPRAAVKVGLVLLMIFGLTGSIIGIAIGLKSLVADVKANPNPFKDLFHFGPPS